MNSTGKELTQADLIRNFILMGLNPQLQTDLYVDYWRPMELDFGQEAYNKVVGAAPFDSFMRHYLTVKTGAIPRLDAVYDAFKAYALSPNVAKEGVGSLVADIRKFARYYCAMALPETETDRNLNLAFRDLRELKVDVAYPFLLELYHDYADDVLSEQDFVEAVRLVEAYVFRRAICSIPTNSLNKTFATFTKALKKDRYLESIKANLLLLPSYRRFPNDEEFKQDLQTRDLYNFRSRSYWLRRLENYGHKELIDVDDYTIEHILPQNPNLSKGWKDSLGLEWGRIRETWLHTLGNLTLTRYNPELSDRTFVEKRDMEGGFKMSPLRLNDDLRSLAHWNEETIKARAQRLSAVAVTVWRAPQLLPDELDVYRPRVEATSAFTIEDHPFLLSGVGAQLFEAFRNQVLALDPVVKEEFYKIYVAYKAETNFVDIVPQSGRLRLTLNMQFPEIIDQRGLCRDVTGMGHWGNGDVEVAFSSLEELPYIMGLVRQSFERQMGNGDEL